MGALPKAMAKRGHRVMAVVPRYRYEGLVHHNHTDIMHFL